MPVVVLALAVFLTGCQGEATDPIAIEDVIPPDAEGQWTIQVVSPEGEWLACWDSDSIERIDNHQNDSPPTTTAVLRAGSTQQEAESIRNCLARNLTAGDIYVGGPDL